MDSFTSRLDASLKKRAHELARLTAVLRSELPPEIDGHFNVANIHDRTLVIMTDSPVWTTRLRQLGPRILTILQNNGGQKLLHIRVFSRPARAAPARPSAPVKTGPKTISPQSSQMISQTAACIADDDLRAALEESDVVYTDTWIDMEFFTDPSFAQEKERRIQLFQPYQLNREILADLDLRIMHCLPAHRGFEIAGELIDDPRSVLFAQAENRLHSQKAVLLKLAAERV